MGFYSVPELHMLKQEFLCMALPGVESLNPAMNKIWVIKPALSRLVWRSKPAFLCGLKLGMSLRFLAVLAQSGVEGPCVFCISRLILS